MRALHDLPFSEEDFRQADTPKLAAAANEDCLLSELQFLCAHTNMSIGTGILTDNRALALAKARACTMHLKCPHYGMTHSVTMDEAMLVRSLRWEDRADWAMSNCCR
ncbi:MAG: hypothetical protein P8Y71_12965 [Pseudolabrys sp.]